MADNYFSQLYGINVKDKTEKKGNLTYLSWTWAWAEVKKLHPDAFYTVYENADGLNYHTDGRTCWVKTGVTVNGIEHIEYLPVMDSRNKSIPLAGITSFDVNRAIQRSITKACARHGLGLYIYAGEDLPESDEPDVPSVKENKPQRQQSRPDLPDKPSTPAQQQSAPRMAAPGQKKFITENATDEEYEATMKAFGAELENLTYAVAEKLVAKIQRRMNNAD